MAYYFPFGQELYPLVQEDQSPKKVFVLGVYASAVHARWKKDGKVVIQALAVASEPRIFWDGNPEEAKKIIDAIAIPSELGVLEPASRQLNGPSAKVLEENILAPLGFTREDAWLCDCLPETRINPSQARAIREKYVPLIEEYGLNPVTIPTRPSSFCDAKRSKEITEELLKSEAELLVLLGDIPTKQYLKKVADVISLDALSIAEASGSAKAVNVVLIGVLAGSTDIPRKENQTLTLDRAFIDAVKSGDPSGIRSPTR